MISAELLIKFSDWTKKIGLSVNCAKFCPRFLGKEWSQVAKVNKTTENIYSKPFKWKSVIIVSARSGVETKSFHIFVLCFRANMALYQFMLNGNHSLKDVVNKTNLNLFDFYTILPSVWFKNSNIVNFTKLKIKDWFNLHINCWSFILSKVF